MDYGVQGKLHESCLKQEKESVLSFQRVRLSKDLDRVVAIMHKCIYRVEINVLYALMSGIETDAFCNLGPSVRPSGFSGLLSDLAS